MRKRTVPLPTRSRKHHEIPRWILRSFCTDGLLWVGFKLTRRVLQQRPGEVFFLDNGYTITSHSKRSDGTTETVISDEHEEILSRFDDQTSSAALKLIEWARVQLSGRKRHEPLSERAIDQCKRLIIGQARRTKESQERGGVVSDFEDTFFEVLYGLAEAVDFKFPARRPFAANAEVQAKILESKQKTRARFASGDHSILQEKEDAFLRDLGLQVAMAPPSSPGFVIGSHGVTIVGAPRHEHTWLPLAPDVAISFLPSGGLLAAICTDSFVEEHNKAALVMSNSIAGNSKRPIEELLATLDP